ncbi:hypothetical protein NC651_006354 [Populus alba x Populus x berolinensis]|nr:hypothetical protein NC651_006354 [Populus alba x Populus x berolinensis]
MGTSHGYYPSPHDACRYHRMSFSGFKARETPRTGAVTKEKKETENRGDDWRSKQDRNRGREQKSSVPQLRLRLQNKHSRQTKTERLEHKNKRPGAEDGRAEKPDEKTRKKNQ